MAQKRTKRSRLPAEERRQQLLDAAAGVILDHGFDDLTMEAITDRAGVSKALGYAYFDRLEDLLHELHTREFSVIYERLIPIMLSDESIENRLESKVRTYFEIISERHDLYLSLNQNLQGPTYRQERKERHAKWEQFVADVVAREFVIDADESRVVARLLMVLDDRCVSMWTRGGRPREEMEDFAIRFQLAALEGLYERRSD